MALGALSKHLLDVLGTALAEDRGEVLSSEIGLKEMGARRHFYKEMDPLFLE